MALDLAQIAADIAACKKAAGPVEFEKDGVRTQFEKSKDIVDAKIKLDKYKKQCDGAATGLKGMRRCVATPQDYRHNC